MPSCLLRALLPAMPHWVGWLAVVWGMVTGSVGEAGQADASRSTSLADTLARVQARMVKIYGAGGPRGLEAYQTGMLISAEGHILTAWSSVLDTEDLSVTLADGRKFPARLLGADVRLETAVLHIEAKDLPHFDLDQAVEVESGTRVLVLSNLFGVAVGNEPVSVQRGTVSVKTRLEGRRGVFDTPYHGPVYVLDMVTNNPGAAGGALVTRHGELVAMLGKELRNALNHTWLNYAIPISQLRESVAQIRAGKYVVRDDRGPAKKPARALTPEAIGLILVPDILERTPPYVDHVVPGGAAARAGIRPDDLVILVGDRLVPSCKALRTELSYVDFEDPVKLTVLRAQELREFVVQASADPKK